MNSSWSEGLSVRSKNFIKNAGINSKAEAVSFFSKPLNYKDFHNFSKGSYDEIITFLNITIENRPCILNAIKLLQENGYEVTKK